MIRTTPTTPASSRDDRPCRAQSGTVGHSRDVIEYVYDDDGTLLHAYDDDGTDVARFDVIPRRRCSNCDAPLTFDELDVCDECS